MAVLTGYLPVEQGIACYAALQRSADTAVATGDSRTRDQIMADTLVERLTGQAAAGDLNIELQLMMPLDTLIKPDDQSAAVIPGYGPLPRELAWELLTTSRDGNGGGGSSPHPRKGQTGAACTPIRHIDHVTRYSDGGSTTFTNGRGVCARGNLIREMPGWRIKPTDCENKGEPHKIIITTPTATTTSAARPTHHETEALRRAESDR